MEQTIGWVSFAFFLLVVLPLFYGNRYIKKKKNFSGRSRVDITVSLTIVFAHSLLLLFPHFVSCSQGGNDLSVFQGRLFYNGLSFFSLGAVLWLSLGIKSRIFLFDMLRDGLMRMFDGNRLFAKMFVGLFLLWAVVLMLAPVLFDFPVPPPSCFFSRF